MSYSCRIYHNSGFNAINIPDSPSLLDTVAFSDHPALEIYQNRNLDHVDIKVSGYDAIKTGDYCLVGDWFYFIDEIYMLSGDTARLILTPDFITSAGGINAIEILDGITNRVHVASDDYGQWCEADPYLAPAEPLTFRGENIVGSSQKTIVVKSTLDLSAMGAATTKDGVTYTDQTSGETVTVPKTQINNGATNYALQGQGVSSLPSESATKLFNANNATVRKGLAEVNDLGINGAVSAQVAIPDGYVTTTTESDGHISSAVGLDTEHNLPTLLFDYSGAQNRRIDYSEYTPFGIISASGDKMEFTPADLYVSGLASPLLRTVSDPRTDGKPYFRFKHYKTDTSLEGFFTNAVAGIPWKETPLVYEGQSGKALTQLAHNQQVVRKAVDMAQQIAASEPSIRMKENLLGASAGIVAGVGAGAAILGPGALGGLLAGAGTAGSLGATGIVGSAIGTLGNALVKGIDEVTGRENLNRVLQKYQIEKGLELQSFIANTSAYEPVMQFPFSADLYADLYNNPCFCYRYKYQPNDIARIDKMLTMYGYRVTKPLEKSDFTNRAYFNYVESSVSVGGQFPRWLCNGIALQLMNGVRVWHVLPSRAYYTNNPIV